MSAKRTPPSVGEGYLLLTPGDTLALNDQYYAGENAGWREIGGQRVGRLVHPNQLIRRRDPSVGLPVEPEPVTVAGMDPSFGGDLTTVTTVEITGDSMKVLKTEALPITPEQIYTTWSRTPDGLKVTDTRVPGDPVRLGSILDDNARIAFLAGYHAASPSFE